MKQERILLTGFRLIGILEVLYKKELTRADIINWFVEKQKIKSFSIETLKLDLNTLNKLGYKLDRIRKNTLNYLSFNQEIKMVMLDETEVIFMLAIKNLAMELLDYKEIFVLKKFFKKVSKFVQDEHKAQFNDFKFFNFVNEKIILILENAISNKKSCEILYDSPSKEKKKIEILPLQILTRNNKFYLKCYSKTHTGIVSYRIDNIKAVNILLKQEIFEEIKKPKERFVITKKYYDFGLLQKQENIVEENKKFLTIETDEENDFFLMQRIITMQKDCVGIKNKEIKEKILDSLKETMEIYK